GVLLLGAGIAALVTWWRAPSMQDAALLIDDRFNLKERVTTALGLTSREAESLAGRALLADVDNRLRPLRGGDRVPVRLSWSAARVPLVGVLLALTVILKKPVANVAEADDGGKPMTDDPELKKLVEQKKKDILAATKDKEDAADKPKDPKVEK